MSQLKDITANEEAWRRLNATLHCGETKMKLKAMGPGAADLQLDMGIVTQPSLAENLSFMLMLKTFGMLMYINVSVFLLRQWTPPSSAPSS